MKKSFFQQTSDVAQCVFLTTLYACYGQRAFRDASQYLTDLVDNRHTNSCNYPDSHQQLQMTHAIENNPLGSMCLGTPFALKRNNDAFRKLTQEIIDSGHYQNKPLRQLFIELPKERANIEKGSGMSQFFRLFRLCCA